MLYIQLQNMFDIQFTLIYQITQVLALKTKYAVISSLKNDQRVIN